MSVTKILVSEVGPRDGLQNIPAIMPTAAKIAWIEAEAVAGVREIEVGSFVSATLFPQLADTDEVVKAARKISGLTVGVLVPNLQGARRAIEAGAHKITLPLSVSETHSLRNVRRTHAQMIDEACSIGRLLGSVPSERRPIFEGALSTAFGCTLEGPVPPDKVARLAACLMEAGCDEIGLSDTTGYADPAAVRRMIQLVRAAVGCGVLSGLHLHNTRGLGLANALAALEEGITTLDSSMAGLGGCPTAPGASGNIVTEDLCFMLAAMGFDTGVDLAALFKVRTILAKALPGETLYGFAAEAGLPLGFVQKKM
jgi:hydroxymethylglutaryl-CoA lyase